MEPRDWIFHVKWRSGWKVHSYMYTYTGYIYYKSLHQKVYTNYHLQCSQICLFYLFYYNIRKQLEIGEIFYFQHVKSIDFEFYISVSHLGLHKNNLRLTLLFSNAALTPLCKIYCFNDEKQTWFDKSCNNSYFCIFFPTCVHFGNSSHRWWSKGIAQRQLGK